MTGQQIEDSIFQMLKSGSLSGIIDGKVYKFGTRPKDSVKEDAIVKFVTGLPGQIQSGTVLINIYVPDIDPYESGIYVKDIERCITLETAAEAWFNSLTTSKSNFKFSLFQTISTEEEPEINQHFVSVKLKFELSTI